MLLPKRRCPAYSLQLKPLCYVLFFPKLWFLFIIRKKPAINFFYLSSSTYKFNFLLDASSHTLQFVGGSLQFFFHKINRFLLLFLANIKQLLFFFSVPFFKKVKFRGKGYYIYKNSRNTITPQFGYAHRIYIYSYFNIVKFLSKVKVFIFGLLKSDVFLTSQILRSKRPINIFTGRGVRFARQVIYKKVGKVSSYR